MELCRHLRWKTFSKHSGDPDQVWESLLRNQVQFSCMRTCQPWGPDDELAAPECCHGGRGCFVADPMSGRGRGPGPRVA